MSDEVQYCREDKAVEAALLIIGQIQVRRLPVVDEDKQPVGIVSLSDFSPSSASESRRALAEIARSAASHSQSI